MTTDAQVFQDEVNAIIAEQAWRFGPVRVRRIEHRHPRRTVTHRIVDANGRRMSIGADLPAEFAAKRLHNRHMKRMQLDHEEQRVRNIVAATFEGLLHRPARVMLVDSDGAERNSFMCFAVELDLLDDTLRRASHLLDYRPYTDAGDVPARFAAAQRRRMRILEDRDGRDPLTCCPVLAARIAAADNPSAWLDLLRAAVDGDADPHGPRFEDGRLVGLVEMTPGSYHAGRKGTWWRRDALSVPTSMPDALAAALKGRPLSTIAQHPFLPGEAVIGRVRQGIARTTVSVKTQAIPFASVLRDLEARAGNPTRDGGSQ